MSLKIITIIQHSIYCDKCHSIQNYYVSEQLYHKISPDVYFDKQGWKDIEGQILCPKCVEIINKEKEVNK